MDYEKLANTYWTTQVEGVEDTRKRIVERGQAAVAGRVVPADVDLVAGTGRRLPMAVMFVDLCRFSSRLSETPEEQDMLLRVFNLFFTEMIRIVGDYGGTVEKNTGDGLMAYFEDGGGDPVAEGCLRALACALTLDYGRMNLVNPVIRASNLEELHFRITMDWGYVTIAQIGAARRFGSLVAIGTTANVASKMLDVAGDDEILLGENVLRRLPAHWQWCVLHKQDTGWVYRQTEASYRFFRYTARWTQPL